ncbi:MAG TPA: PTS sugar transporter subunit IIA [Spirochaetia bacterium]|nr:PTS sugar transporter subunit IIA [Spirochaetia bacterium]
MLLSELIQPDLIRLNMEAADKWEAIEELVDHLIGAHELRLTNRQEVVDSLFARERSLSTGLEHGLAVPHGSVDCVSDILAAIGLSRRGIPFESLDGKPARLIVLLVIPKGAFQRHVRTLAGIARLALNQVLRERILDAKSEQEVMDVIFELESAEESTDGGAALK